MGVLPDDIEERLRQEVERRGLVLLELHRRGQRNSSVLEVIVDSEHGVALDELTELSRWVGALLDANEDAIPGRYRLEVSSGGLDRPLEYEWQYRKNIGRLVKVTFDDETGARQTKIFRLIDTAPDGITVEPIQSRGKARTVPEPLTIPLERITRTIIEPEI
jgi:ribosome maturation factor RimP